MPTNLPAKYSGSKFVSGLAKAKDAAVSRAASAQQAAKAAQSGTAVIMRQGIVAIPTAGVCGALDGAMGDRADNAISTPEVLTIAGGLAAIVTGSPVLGSVTVGAASASAYKHGRKLGAKYKLKMAGG